ncbi:MAG: hypothetical protein Ta2F_10570 [Termitinemataceae bacterium]|nr:MAG: hypothetical protein Ta2F_10570 [Termitinemataceae bacterium]
MLTLSGNEMRLENLYTVVGKTGACNVSGTFFFDRWVPGTFSISIDASDVNPIPIALNISGFIANGFAHGNLNLSKDGEALNVNGDIVCNEAELTLADEDAEKREKEKTGKKNKKEKSKKGKDAQDIIQMQKNERINNLMLVQNIETSKMPKQIDLTVTVGNKVEFLWPNARFPIIRANATAGNKIAITNDTLANHFSLKGDIDIKTGEIFYFQRSFYIKQGTISFNESEISFDPRITARAETRDMTNNEAVTISMVINNQTLSNFTPVLESNPPLSQVEILALMGEKIMGTPGDENSVPLAVLSSTADLLAQFAVVRQFEKTLRKILHVDMFSFRTQAIQNTILLNLPFNGQGGSTTPNNAADNMDTPVDSRNQTRIGNYFDNTTVYIGKYIGTGVFAQAMLSLRYDKDKLDMGGLRIEPDISMEFQSPLFYIRCDVIPTHPETYFVGDTKFTVTKKWTLP